MVPVKTHFLGIYTSFKAGETATFLGDVLLITRLFTVGLGLVAAGDFTCGEKAH
jgi:hypothetical protein